MNNITSKPTMYNYYTEVNKMFILLEISNKFSFYTIEIISLPRGGGGGLCLMSDKNQALNFVSWKYGAVSPLQLGNALNVENGLKKQAKALVQFEP